VPRVGYRWEALNYTGICKKSPAYRRFQHRAAALHQHAELHGIESRWQAIDGVMTKAPLGEKTRKNHRIALNQGVKRSLLTDGCRTPLGNAIPGPNVPDYQMTEETLESIPVSRPDPPVPSTPEALAARQIQDSGAVQCSLSNMDVGARLIALA